MMHRWINSLKADHISFFFQVSFSRNTLLATCLMSLTSYCSLLIEFGRYNQASRCSPSLLPCAWTKYRNRCAHKYHSTSTYSVIFMLQRSSLCICLNSRFFQYLVSHLWVSTCSLITLAPPGLRRPETVLWFPIILAPSWNTVWKWELKWQSLKKLGVKSGTGGRFCSRPAGKRD